MGFDAPDAAADGSVVGTVVGDGASCTEDSGASGDAVVVGAHAVAGQIELVDQAIVHVADVEMSGSAGRAPEGEVAQSGLSRRDAVEGRDDSGGAVQLVDRAGVVSGRVGMHSVDGGGGDVDVGVGGVIQRDPEHLAEVPGAPFFRRAGSGILYGDLVVEAAPGIGPPAEAGPGGCQFRGGGIEDQDHGREGILREVVGGGAGKAGGDHVALLEGEEILDIGLGRGSRGPARCEHRTS